MIEVGGVPSLGAHGESGNAGFGAKRWSVLRRCLWRGRRFFYLAFVSGGSVAGCAASRTAASVVADSNGVWDSVAEGGATSGGGTWRC